MKYAAIFLGLLLLLLTGCTTISDKLKGIGTPVVQTFDATPSVINTGDTSSLRWNTLNAQSVHIDNGIGDVATNGTLTVQPNTTSFYTLTAKNAMGITTARTQIVVRNVQSSNDAVAIVSFEAKPAVITSGDTATLEWDVVGANSIVIEPGIGSRIDMTGNLSVSPQTTTTYTLTTQGDSGSVSKSVIITVNPAPPVIVSFTAFPEHLEYVGKTTLLRWNVTGATRVRIEPDIGEVPAGGNYGIMPQRDTTYVLTAQSACCVVSRSITVTVTGSNTNIIQGGPIVELFNITPDSIYRGDSATLLWRVSGANSVSIDQGIGAVLPSDSITVSPSVDTTYTMTVANEINYYPVSVKLLVYER